MKEDFSVPRESNTMDVFCNPVTDFVLFYSDQFSRNPHVKCLVVKIVANKQLHIVFVLQLSSGIGIRVD